MIQLRDYQKKIVSDGVGIIKEHGMLYLSMAVRTGKTITSLDICSKLNAENVLFLTKLKVIPGIKKDYNDLGCNFNLTCTNYESIHKIESNKWDVIVCDESHSCFLGDTLVDGIKIKDIPLGHSLKSFNFDKNIYEHKKVVNIYKNKLNENLIKIKCNGKEIVCTESHKIFTKRGWVEARNILPSDELQVLQQGAN